ncbi:MAG TPA: hypothetical protein VE962_06130, partial [Actinomycetota bacterium]|nr:hypothetical protein [Actinomycetota bacterium]
SSLTARDKAANDVLHLLSLDAPRSDTPAVLDPPAESGFRCTGIFDLLEDALITKAGEEGDAERPDPSSEEQRRPARRRRTTRAARDAETRAAWEESARRKATNTPGVRGVEILALLREMSLLRRWDARGRLRAIERFRRRVAEPDVRRYVTDVRGMVRAAKGISTSVQSELRPEERNA